MSYRAKDALGGGDGIKDRWMAEIKYNHGGVDIFCLEELEDLDEIVERGPDWNTIEKIEITLNRPTITLPQEQGK